MQCPFFREELEGGFGDVFKMLLGQLPVNVSGKCSEKDNKKIHTASGFIPNLDDPVAKNMFFDNLGPY
mgnify:CR=1 FL=1